MAMTEPKEEELNAQFSPLNPPDAYHPPSSENMATEDLHPFLRSFVKENDAIRAALLKFEETIMVMKAKGVTAEVNGNLKEFFQFFNEEFIPHARREEKTLFPILDQALRKERDEGLGLEITTAVDLMEDDHLKAIQLTVVIFNFFGLVSRLKDQVSRDLVMDAAFEQADQLIELLRLHIFREDTIVFPLAHKTIDPQELDRLTGWVRRGL
jgi:hemerythrin-like domain-containing protein